MKNFLKIAVLVCMCFACEKNKKETTHETSKETKKEVAKENKTPKLLHEIKGLTHCESVVYDAKRNVLYASLIGNRETGDGSIAKISLDGKVIDTTFVSGLNDPKGIAITGDKLYVSDVTVLVEANLENGEIINRHTTEGTQFLNDVEIGKDGTVYVSDTFKSSIFTLTSDGTFSEWFSSDTLEHPNGLLNIGNDMYVAAWGNEVGEGEKKKQSGRFLKLDITSKKLTQITKDTLGNLDGVQVYNQNNMLVSAWNTGKIMKVSKEGNVEDILKVGRSVGDILYVPEKKLLALPMNIQSSLLIYELP